MTTKTHISLNVNNLDEAIDFYRGFFCAEPAKVRPGYANFDLEDPPLKLALNESKGGGRVSHLGWQVPDTGGVDAAIERLAAADLNGLEERDADCCHAVQDKVWATDPDGNRWEVFVVKADAPQVGSQTAGCACRA